MKYLIEESPEDAETFDAAMEAACAKQWERQTGATRASVEHLREHNPRFAAVVDSHKGRGDVHKRYRTALRWQEQASRLGIHPGDIAAWHRQSARLHSRYEAACNDESAQGPEWDSKTARLERLLVARIEKRGLHCYLQTDPRGASLYIDLTPIPNDNYTRAECIYRD